MRRKIWKAKKAIKKIIEIITDSEISEVKLKDTRGSNDEVIED